MAKNPVEVAAVRSVTRPTEGWGDVDNVLRDVPGAYVVACIAGRLPPSTSSCIVVGELPSSRWLRAFKVCYSAFIITSSHVKILTLSLATPRTP